MTIQEHVELIKLICEAFNWKANRLRQFRRAGEYAREIDGHLKYTLKQLNINH